MVAFLVGIDVGSQNVWKINWLLLVPTFSAAASCLPPSVTSFNLSFDLSLMNFNFLSHSVPEVQQFYDSNTVQSIAWKKPQDGLWMYVNI